MRRKYRKMSGGINTPDDSFESNGSLHLSDLDVGDNVENMEQQEGPVPEIPWENSNFSGATTINTNDWSLNNQSIDSIEMATDDEHDVDMDENLDLDLEGGRHKRTNKRSSNKRNRTKRRKNKRKTAKRKTNKRKSIKHKRRH